MATGKIKGALTTYNTDETVVGTWINGKPLYRKIITASITGPTTWVSENAVYASNCVVVSFRGMLYEPFAAPFPDINSAFQVQSIAWADPSDYKIHVVTQRNFTMKSVFVIEYYKTTD